MNLSPSRDVALERLANFVPAAANYATSRNFDLGPDRHHGVSQLSPFIRTRLLTEEEVTREVLSRHSIHAAEKFLQEVAWRTYWKGWLEMRPQVWDDYLFALSELKIVKGTQAAIDGNTGIDCFDSWVRELVTTGYLHNHARMWFASIWIFTLRLPWQHGADFFFRHLLDADAASNTLSWRWVAGLHTPGKHYLARASNIKKFTQNRFDPSGQLNESAPPIPLDQCYERQPLTIPADPRPPGRIGHLLLPEDLAPVPAHLGRVHATCAYLPPILKSTPLVAEFLNEAVDQTLESREGKRLEGDFLSSLQQWIDTERLDTVLLSYPTVGPSKDFLAKVGLPSNVQLFLRDWDRQLWPHATAGFFKLKKALPKFYNSLTTRAE